MIVLLSYEASFWLTDFEEARFWLAKSTTCTINLKALLRNRLNLPSYLWLQNKICLAKCSITLCDVQGLTFGSIVHPVEFDCCYQLRQKRKLNNQLENHRIESNLHYWAYIFDAIKLSTIGKSLAQNFPRENNLVTWLKIPVSGLLTTSTSYQTRARSYLEACPLLKVII